MRLRSTVTAKAKDTNLRDRSRIIRAVIFTTMILTCVFFFLSQVSSVSIALTKLPSVTIAAISSPSYKTLLTNDSRILELSGSNRHMVYLHKPNVLFVTMAKAGSSSLWHWLYRGVTGVERWDNSGCRGHVHEKRAICWQGHASYLFMLPVEEQRRILTANETLRIAIQRDPYERLVSAYKSKFTCDGDRFSTDVHERESMVKGLRKWANFPATKNIDGQQCMNVTEFARALDACRIHVGEPYYPPSLYDLDDHIRPQNFFFDEVDYHMVIDVRHLSDISVMRPVIQRLPYHDLVRDGIPHRHSSGNTLLSIPEDAATLLYAFALESKPGRIKFMPGAYPSEWSYFSFLFC